MSFCFKIQDGSSPDSSVNDTVLTQLWKGTTSVLTLGASNDTLGSYQLNFQQISDVCLSARGGYFTRADISVRDAHMIDGKCLQGKTNVGAKHYK